MHPTAGAGSCPQAHLEWSWQGKEGRTGVGGCRGTQNVQRDTEQGRKSCQSQHQEFAQLLPRSHSCGRFLQLRESIHKPGLGENIGKGEGTGKGTGCPEQLPLDP